MHPTHGTDRDDTFTEQTCSWCSDFPDERPCSPECESIAVLAQRTKRIEGLTAGLLRAIRLRLQYAAEGIPDDHRLVALDAQVAEWERQIRVTLAAMRADRAEAA